ncbi:chorismate-binding protein [Salmonirosea aquatica]|uniref:isochorismate synthase n=1 Tax=Salmonirosea aquatica TaxID=2654236 RepID=A0A7C9BMT8_9BACT|nr:isochorismate synthase [Cytophagaceae bacterium SJW1-29]
MLEIHSVPEIGIPTYQAESLWSAALALGFPAAVWRLPNRNEINLLISLGGDTQRKKTDLETLLASFVVHPFRESEDSYVLEGDLIFTYSENSVLKNVVNKLGDEHPTVKVLFDQVTRSNPVSERDTLVRPASDPRQVQESDESEHFKALVAEAVAAIKAGEFAKIVLSRTKKKSYSADFQPYQAFNRLQGTYPSAFVSLVSLPERNELWLGASPETLVSVDANAIFRTTSLAGTQAALDAEGVLIPAGEVRWGQKEIQEQALVSRYIVECFKKIRLREYYESGPKTVRAGNLYHLRTDFEVHTAALNFPELGTVMLELLHPTSAVCGTPKEAALRFIEAAEGYDRSLYSGYLGPVNVDQESALFVNLRTVRLSEGEATLYAGAGITEDSDPQREWEETEMKCQTLLAVLT